MFLHCGCACMYRKSQQKRDTKKICVPGFPIFSTLKNYLRAYLWFV